jgi:hypothetical protein
VRRLLAHAELRKACVDVSTGRLLSLAGSVERPAVDDPQELRSALAAMVLTETVVTPDDPAVRAESQHDPSDPLRRFVVARDAGCDGPGCSVPAGRCDLDHEEPWPAGPTSAGNLAARSERCHQAKHAGWSAERRSDGSTLWTSPGGRRYVVLPRHGPPPGVAPGRRLLAADDLAALDAALLRPEWPAEDDWGDDHDGGDEFGDALTALPRETAAALSLRPGAPTDVLPPWEVACTAAALASTAVAGTALADRIDLRRYDGAAPEHDLPWVDCLV